MTGRQMYERLCELRLLVPDWWSLSESTRGAWEELASEIGVQR